MEIYRNKIVSAIAVLKQNKIVGELRLKKLNERVKDITFSKSDLSKAKKRPNEKGSSISSFRLNKLAEAFDLLLKEEFELEYNEHVKSYISVQTPDIKAASPVVFNYSHRLKNMEGTYNMYTFERDTQAIQISTLYISSEGSQLMICSRSEEDPPLSYAVSVGFPDQNTFSLSVQDPLFNIYILGELNQRRLAKSRKQIHGMYLTSDVDSFLPYSGMALFEYVNNHSVKRKKPRRSQRDLIHVSEHIANYLAAVGISSPYRGIDLMKDSPKDIRRKVHGEDHHIWESYTKQTAYYLYYYDEQESSIYKLPFQIIKDPISGKITSELKNKNHGDNYTGVLTSSYTRDAGCLTFNLRHKVDERKFLNIMFYKGILARVEDELVGMYNTISEHGYLISGRLVLKKTEQRFANMQPKAIKEEADKLEEAPHIVNFLSEQAGAYLCSPIQAFGKPVLPPYKSFDSLQGTYEVFFYHIDKKGDSAPERRGVAISVLKINQFHEVSWRSCFKEELTEGYANVEGYNLNIRIFEDLKDVIPVEKRVFTFRVADKKAKDKRIYTGIGLLKNQQAGNRGPMAFRLVLRYIGKAEAFDSYTPKFISQYSTEMDDEKIIPKEVKSTFDTRYTNHIGFMYGKGAIFDFDELHKENTSRRPENNFAETFFQAACGYYLLEDKPKMEVLFKYLERAFNSGKGKNTFEIFEEKVKTVNENKYLFLKNSKFYQSHKEDLQSIYKNSE